jgi:hypothetical protein
MPRIFYIAEADVPARAFRPIGTAGLEEPHWPGWYLELVEGEHWLGPYGSPGDAEAMLRTLLRQYGDARTASRVLLGKAPVSWLAARATSSAKGAAR